MGILNLGSEKISVDQAVNMAMIELFKVPGYAKAVNDEKYDYVIAGKYGGKAEPKEGISVFVEPIVAAKPIINYSINIVQSASFRLEDNGYGNIKPFSPSKIDELDSRLTKSLEDEKHIKDRTLSMVRGYMEQFTESMNKGDYKSAEQALINLGSIGNNERLDIKIETKIDAKALFENLEAWHDTFCDYQKAGRYASSKEAAKSIGKVLEKTKKMLKNSPVGHYDIDLGAAVIGMVRENHAYEGNK